MLVMFIRVLQTGSRDTERTLWNKLLWDLLWSQVCLWDTNNTTWCQKWDPNPHLQLDKQSLIVNNLIGPMNEQVIHLAQHSFTTFLWHTLWHTFLWQLVSCDNLWHTFLEVFWGWWHSKGQAIETESAEWSDKGSEGSWLRCQWNLPEARISVYFTEDFCSC